MDRIASGRELCSPFYLLWSYVSVFELYIIHMSAKNQDCLDAIYEWQYECVYSTVDLLRSFMSAFDLENMNKKLCNVELL